MLTCNHQWGETDKVFTPPNPYVTSINGYTVEILERLLYGMTTITQTCQKCGQARSYTVGGQA